jgi:hypothetical protein|uniref:Uncharacterized protein n=1 Tax=Picea glauca TaxID=3330 RepID=A0A124GNE0_PICGL|nr:hypothetical protein ABT39_MTgene4533 [Picea glauca]QHR91208.1 hypothetical protein Q903MT_gene5240 [Picea sitchensis]
MIEAGESNKALSGRIQKENLIGSSPHLLVSIGKVQPNLIYLLRSRMLTLRLFKKEKNNGNHAPMKYQSRKHILMSLAQCHTNEPGPMPNEGWLLYHRQNK